MDLQVLFIGILMLSSAILTREILVVRGHWEEEHPPEGFRIFIMLVVVFWSTIGVIFS